MTPPSGGPAVAVRDLRKSYGAVEAVRGISFAIHAGECFGLLGPNGAGKTTTVEILEGLLPPTSGEAVVLGRRWGRDDREIRERLGVCLQQTVLSEKLEVGETVALFRAFYREGRAPREVVGEVGLQEKARARVGTLSGGQKQRLAVACALVGDPELLFLDEPTTNLDPHGRKEILELIADIAADPGLQVLVSSHILSDIEALCASVVILNKGKVAAQGLLEDLRASDFSLFEIRIKGDTPAFRRRLEAAGCKTEETEDKLLRVFMPQRRERFGTGNARTSRPASADSREIFAAARETDVQIRHFVRSRTSLEDLFARAVGVD